MNNSNEKKNNPTLRAIVIYLLILTLILTGVTFSKYITKSIGSDLARSVSIGDVEITETGDFYEPGKMKIIPGTSLEKNVKISFSGTESKSYIFLELKLSDHWNKNGSYDYEAIYDGETLMSFSMKGDWKYLKSENQNRYIYYKELEPNTTFNETAIKDNCIVLSKEITRDNITGLTDATISFRATATQADELTVEEAWNLIK